MKTYHVRKIDGSWQVRQTGSKEANIKFPRKSDAVKAAREMCKAIATHQKPISLKICTSDGEIKQEYTYPRSADPRRSKG